MAATSTVKAAKIMRFGHTILSNGGLVIRVLGSLWVYADVRDSDLIITPVYKSSNSSQMDVLSGQ